MISSLKRTPSLASLISTILEVSLKKQLSSSLCRESMQSKRKQGSSNQSAGNRCLRRKKNRFYPSTWTLISADWLNCSADRYISNTLSRILIKTCWGGNHCKISPILIEVMMKTMEEAMMNKIITLLMFIRENLAPMLWLALRMACWLMDLPQISITFSLMSTIILWELIMLLIWQLLLETF